MATSATPIAGSALAPILLAVATLMGWTLQPAPAAESATGASAASTVTGGGVTLHSVSVELPAGDRIFPGGAKADAINNNCLACHSAGMVLTQPRLSRAEWQAEVEKMRNTYKAPVTAADMPAIVDYLADLNNSK
jgi:hypothetical protein